MYRSSFGSNYVDSLLSSVESIICGGRKAVDEVLCYRYRICQIVPSCEICTNATARSTTSTLAS